MRTLRRDLLKVSEAVGVVHPGLVTPDDVDVMTGVSGGRSLRELYAYDDTWGRLGPSLRAGIEQLMCSPVEGDGDSADGEALPRRRRDH